MSESSISEGSFVRVGEEIPPVQPVAEEVDWTAPDEPEEPQRPPSPSTASIIDREFEVVEGGTVPTEDDAQSISSIGPSISLVNAPVAQPASEPVAQTAAEPVAQPAAEPVAETAAEPDAVPAAEPVAKPVAEEQQQQPVSTPDAEEPLPISVATSPPRVPVRLRSAERPAARSRSQRQTRSPSPRRFNSCAPARRPAAADSGTDWTNWLRTDQTQCHYSHQPPNVSVTPAARIDPAHRQPEPRIR